MANIPECAFRWDKTPVRGYRVDMPIEKAVADLIGYHNEERARVMPRSQLQAWIDTEQESHGNNRTIRSGDIVQVELGGAALGKKHDLLGCGFEYDGQRTTFRGPVKNRPKTVDEYYTLLTGKGIEQKRTIVLRIARFGTLEDSGSENTERPKVTRRTTSIRKKDGSERATFED